MLDQQKPTTLQDQLAAEIVHQEAAFAARPGGSEGEDWWQLSRAEEEVFQIDRDRFARLYLTLDCYEAFKLISGNPAWDQALIEAERRKRPEWAGADHSEIEFQAFAKVFGGLTYRESHAIWCRYDFWTIRLGVATFTDEARQCSRD